MNPSIEVQITARLDKLDAGLKVAEAKISQSAQTMGKTGEQGGSQFAQRMIGNMAKGLAMGAVSNVLGGGILTALQGINAGKSGEDIGMEISKGIIDGAKSIPVVGTVVAIIDEMINGMDRLAAAAHDRAAAVANSFRQAFSDIAKSSEMNLQTVTRKTQDISAKGDTAQQAKLNTQRTIEDAKAGLKQIEDEKKMLRDKAASAEAASKKAAIADRDASLRYYGHGGGKAHNQKQVDDVLAARVRDAASTRLAAEQSIDRLKVKNIEELNEQILVAEQAGAEDQQQIQQEKLAKYAEMQKTAADKAAADKKTTDDKANADAIASAKKQKKDEFDVAMQAQQDIIDGEKAAQAQIDKIGRVDQLAGQAAQGMISSGQTALGQFNFAQQGAGGTAMDMAKKQVASLEKIDAATAKMVELTRENKGFQ
jgi:hypothetical protein